MRSWSVRVPLSILCCNLTANPLLQPHCASSAATSLRTLCCNPTARPLLQPHGLLCCNLTANPLPQPHGLVCCNLTVHPDGAQVCLYCSKWESTTKISCSTSDGKGLLVNTSLYAELQHLYVCYPTTLLRLRCCAFSPSLIFLILCSGVLDSLQCHLLLQSCTLTLTPLILCSCILGSFFSRVVAVVYADVDSSQRDIKTAANFMDGFGFPSADILANVSCTKLLFNQGASLLYHCRPCVTPLYATPATPVAALYATTTTPVAPLYHCPLCVTPLYTTIILSWSLHCTTIL